MGGANGPETPGAPVLTTLYLLIEDRLKVINTFAFTVKASRFLASNRFT